MVFHKVATIPTGNKNNRQNTSFTKARSFNHSQQCATLWCWAACGGMMVSFHKRSSYSQYDFAVKRFDNEEIYDYECNALPKHFNKPQMPNECLKQLNGILVNGISNSQKDELWTGLVKEIASKTPLLMGISYNEEETDGHFIIVSQVLNGIYYVHNPKYPEGVQKTKEWFFEDSNFSTHVDGAFWSHAFSIK